MINRILLIKLREAGDLLLTVPVVKAIKERYPDSYLAVLVNSGTEDIVTENPLIDKVYVFDRTTKTLPFFKKVVNQVKFTWEIRRTKFNLVFDFTGGDRAAIYSLFCGAKKKVTFKNEQGFLGKQYIYTHRIPYPSIPKHEVEKNLDLIRPFGFNAKDRSPEMFVSKKDVESILAIFSKNNVSNDDLKVHIHPTSKWLFKCWKDEYFAQLMDYLIECYNAKIFLTSGLSEKEQNRANNILSFCNNRPISLVGMKTTLKYLAALSKSCDLFIGIDTGPMHIAASMKTPVIVMFGPSGPVNWGPWGEGHVVITSNKYDCMPCGKDGCNGTKKSKCLESITVDMVKTKVNEALGKLNLTT